MFYQANNDDLFTPTPNIHIPCILYPLWLSVGLQSIDPIISVVSFPIHHCCLFLSSNHKCGFYFYSPLLRVYDPRLPTCLYACPPVCKVTLIHYCVHPHNTYLLSVPLLHSYALSYLIHSLRYSILWFHWYGYCINPDTATSTVCSGYTSRLYLWRQLQNKTLV